MIYVDDRMGSAELAEPLQKMNLPVEVMRLDSADLVWEGRGEEDKSTLVGVEYKQLSECVQAMRTGRLQQQAERMQHAYEFRWLLIEGELLYDSRGRLLRRKGRREFVPIGGGMTIAEFWKRIFVLHLRRGLSPLFTKSQRDTLKVLECLYRVWTDQALDEHQSHIAIYQPPTPVPVNAFRQTLMTLPGVGFKISGAAEEAFSGSLARAFHGHIDVDEWANLQTKDKKGNVRRFGMKQAQAIKEYFK